MGFLSTSLSVVSYDSLVITVDSKRFALKLFIPRIRLPGSEFNKPIQSHYPSHLIMWYSSIMYDGPMQCFPFSPVLCADYLNIRMIRYKQNNYVSQIMAPLLV